MIEEIQTDEIAVLKQKLAETEAKLKDKEMVFNHILESTLAGYWDWQIQDNTEYLSPTFKSMFGYEDHEMPNHPESWQKIIHPDDLPSVYENFNQHVASNGKIPYDNEVRYYHKNGSIVWVYCRGQVIEWDEEGKPTRMLGGHLNITPIKNALKKVEVQKEAIQKKNIELEQFTYIASHDLQEPLITISTYASLLSTKYADQLDIVGNKSIEFMLGATTRMSLLIKGLLDYSRIGKEKKKEAIDLNVLLHGVKEDLGSVIEESNVLIQYDEMPTIIGIETEIRMLFQNLLGNAIKFRKPGVAPEINITSIIKKHQWHFSISDNGIGIAPEHQKKVFTIFQRLHNKKEYEGTGIGLAHCVKIVDFHGGRLKLTSKLGEGSVFKFSIKKVKIV